MPFRDGSGPKGEGSRSGRGAGNCTNQNEKFSQGRRRFNRANRGQRQGVAHDVEISGLEKKLDSLKSALKSISDSLELSKKSDNKE